MELMPELDDNGYLITTAEEHARIMALSGGERLMISAQLFDTYRARILATFPPDLTEEERLHRLTERVYGPEIAAMWQTGWRKRYPTTSNPQ